MGKAVMCCQCGKEIKCVGSVELVGLFVCTKPECPNFCLVQVGLEDN